MTGNQEQDKEVLRSRQRLLKGGSLRQAGCRGEPSAGRRGELGARGAHLNHQDSSYSPDFHTAQEDKMIANIDISESSIP